MRWAVAVALLQEWSLSPPEDPGSNPIFRIDEIKDNFTDDFFSFINEFCTEIKNKFYFQRTN